MTLFLKAHCGSIRLLVDVKQVVEVLDAPVTPQQTAVTLLSHCPWREQILHRINMLGYFNMPDPGADRLIVVDTGLHDPALRFVALAVESSDSLLTLGDEAIADIANQHDSLAPIFSGIYLPPDSSACHLVLRFPASWITTLLAGVDAA